MTQPTKSRASQAQVARGSGNSVTASRSTPMSSSKRMTTRSTCVPASANIYSKRGFDSIDKQDLRGRMRWMGLYTQREQGYDGTWTGDENIDMLEAKYFMMRVRCDGGALTNAALRTLGEISTEFARDTADISDRENVQYHWIRDRGRPGDLGAARRGRAADHRGVRRLPPRGAGLAAGRRVARRGARPDLGS